MGSKKYHDGEWLREKYEDEIMTLAEIGELCGVSRPTISDWLGRHGIEKRSQKETQRLRQEGKHTDREWLAMQYHARKRSLSDIANECDVDPVTIMNWMERFNIPRREWSYRTHRGPVSYAIDDDGYVQVGSHRNGEGGYAKVHQLIAIAEGADPYKVFSDGEYQCHHKKPIPWLNTPDNIEVLTEAEHQHKHWPNRERADTGEFL